MDKLISAGYHHSQASVYKYVFDRIINDNTFSSFISEIQLHVNNDKTMMESRRYFITTSLYNMYLEFKKNKMHYTNYSEVYDEPTRIMLCSQLANILTYKEKTGY